MPVLFVTLTDRQQQFVDRIAKKAQTDAGEVVQTMINIAMQNSIHDWPEGTSHALSVFTPGLDETVYQLREDGYTWPKIMKELAGVMPDVNISYGATRRAYERHKRKLAK